MDQNKIYQTSEKNGSDIMEQNKIYQHQYKIDQDIMDQNRIYQTSEQNQVEHNGIEQNISNIRTKWIKTK